MKVAKRFRWEGAHRLPWHTAGCQHLHGHSYTMVVELEGEPDERGMLVDFKDIKTFLQLLVDAWDHATLVAASDKLLLQAMELLQSKHFVLPYDTTSENICRYVTDYLTTHAIDILLRHSVVAICVRLQESETCYAELETPVVAPDKNGICIEDDSRAVI